MEIIPEDGKFKIESSSRKGKFYSIDPSKPSCTCPQFVYRQSKRHGTCKHIDAVLEYMNANGITKHSQETDEEIVSYVKERETVESLELIEKFSEDKVDALLKHGLLIEKNGVIRVLE